MAKNPPISGSGVLAPVDLSSSCTVLLAANFLHTFYKVVFEVPNMFKFKLNQCGTFFYVPYSSRYIAVWDDSHIAAGIGITDVVLAGSFCFV